MCFWLVGLPGALFFNQFNVYSNIIPYSRVPHVIITLLLYKIVAAPQVHHVVSLPVCHEVLRFHQEKALVPLGIKGTCPPHASGSRICLSTLLG